MNNYTESADCACATDEIFRLLIDDRDSTYVIFYSPCSKLKIHTFKKEGTLYDSKTFDMQVAEDVEGYDKWTDNEGPGLDIIRYDWEADPEDAKGFGLRWVFF